MATLAFLETTTTARAEPSATLRRLTTTLGPANELRVNTPAAAHGPSAATTVKSSVSSLMPTLATHGVEPAGEGDATVHATSLHATASSTSWLRTAMKIAARSSTCAAVSGSRRCRRTLPTWSGAAAIIRSSAGVGEVGVHHPAVGRRGLALDETVADEPVEPAGEPARRQAQGLGEVAHPHPSLGCLGQVDEHLVVAEGELVRGEIALECVHQRAERGDEVAPRRHLRGGEPLASHAHQLNL